MAKKMPALSWLLALALVVFTVIGLRLGLKIRHITCISDNQTCPATQTAYFNSLLGQPILFFNDTNLKKLASTNTEYQLTTVSFELPSTIVLTLNHQVSAYQLATDGQPTPLTISANGQVMSTGTQTTPTTLYVSNDIWNQVQAQHQVNQPLHQQIMDILATLQTNQQTAPFLTWVDSQTLAIDSPGKPQIILDPTNLRTDLARLKVAQQAIQNPLNTPQASGLSQAAEIDVRFQLPVLRTAPTIPRHLAQ